MFRFSDGFNGVGFGGLPTAGSERGHQFVVPHYGPVFVPFLRFGAETAGGVLSSGRSRDVAHGLVADEEAVSEEDHVVLRLLQLRKEGHSEGRKKHPR